MTLSKSAENKGHASDYALFALRFFFSSSPNSQTLAQSLSTLCLSGLTDSQMQTRPSHQSYRYATLKFIFDTLAFPFSASQTLTLPPLILYMFTPPSFLPTTGLGTVQLICHLAQYLFQSSTLTAMEMPAAPNCDTFRVLYKY